MRTRTRLVALNETIQKQHLLEMARLGREVPANIGFTDSADIRNGVVVMLQRVTIHGKLSEDSLYR